MDMASSLGELPGSANAALYLAGNQMAEVLFDVPISVPMLSALLLCVAALVLGRWKDDFAKEFCGTALMVLLTFPPGKWIGTAARWQAWLLHAAGIVVSDWAFGGPHMNPSVSLAMLALGRLESTRFFFSRIAAQVAAALLTLSLCRAAAATVGLPRLGGPAFELASVQNAAMDEALSTAGLMLSIFLLNWELPVRKSYVVKQSLTAGCIRLLLQAFPASGPAMNPALGTASAVAEADGYAFPDFWEHYLCYWAASFLGAFAATAMYGVLFGQSVFGMRLPWSMARRVVTAEPQKHGKQS